MSLSEFFTLLVGVDKPAEKPGGKAELTKTSSEAASVWRRRARFAESSLARGNTVLAEFQAFSFTLSTVRGCLLGRIL